MKNRKLILIVSLVLAMTMSLGGTLAYLQDTDADVNTMVLGNVKITQNEQERDANGELVGFNQNKPALPAVYANGTATGESWAEKGVEFNGVEYKVFDDSMKNVIDKMVTVTNDGNSDAYVRTLIAIEAPEFDTNDLIHINHNGTDCDMSAPVCVTINDVDYVVFAFTYKAAVNPKATTAPSLLQLFLDPVTTNEDVAKFGTTWEVLALSQAIQADGFSDPMTALNAGFGAVTAAKAQEWFGDVVYVEPEEPEANEDGVYEISTAAELFGFAKMVNKNGESFKGKTVKLTADITLTQEWKPVGQTGGNGAATYFQGTFDGQGHTIYNMTITETNKGGNYAAGFFGFIDADKATIKDVNFDNATVNGHHWTAVVVGYMTGVVDNCHVTNSTVTCTHANDDACGDKAGTIVGYVNGQDNTITNNSATNCSVIAGRDAGQIIGSANTKTNTIKDNSATNVKVETAPGCDHANSGVTNRNELIGREL